jgi:hypothetical protein
MNSKAQTALRIEKQMLKRAELLVPHLSRDPLMRAVGQVSRSSVLRVALAKGLADLERELGTIPPQTSHTTAPGVSSGAVVVFSDDWSELRVERKRVNTPGMAPPMGGAPAIAGKEILSLRAQGKSLRQIAAILTDAGISTRRGGRWYASTVRAILKRMESS